MVDKEKCWTCEYFRPYKNDCAILFRDVDPEELRTCICYQKVKPRKEINFEEIINSIDAGRRN